METGSIQMLQRKRPRIKKNLYCTSKIGYSTGLEKHGFIHRYQAKRDAFVFGKKVLVQNPN